MEHMYNMHLWHKVWHANMAGMHCRFGWHVYDVSHYAFAHVYIYMLFSNLSVSSPVS